MTPITYGVSSDLTGPAHAAVCAIWDELEQRYGLRAARAAVQPHVTYVVGECRERQAMAQRLSEAARTLPAIEVTIDGLGTFESATPVVFLRVLKTAALSRIYLAIHQAMRDAGMAIWPNYQPSSWTPHVTLALRDVQPALLPLLLADLRERPSQFTVQLEGLNLVHVVQPMHTYLVSLPLRQPASQR